MYEIFLEKNINSIRQTVDDAFISKYADLSYPELTTLWQEVGLGSYCDGMLKIINPSDYQDVLNSCYIMDYDKSFLPFMCTAFGDVCKHSKKCTFYTLRFGCSFAAVNTIKPQLL